MALAAASGSGTSPANVPWQAGRALSRDAYLVRDDSTGITYSFDHTDIVTEGFRTVRRGERVRFLIDHAHPGKASYVIRLDLPDVEAYYS